MAGSTLSFDYQWQGQCVYDDIYRAMRLYTRNRTEHSRDQFWLLEHQAVYTQGRRQAKSDVVKDIDSIPLVASDRGGLMSYHGPGQAILYTLLDLRRIGISLRTYIHTLEKAVIILLARYGICAQQIKGAPGVYVSHAKIASLALCIYKGCCYHGVALNVDMDLAPFYSIIPCGLTGIKMTQIADYDVYLNVADTCYQLADILAQQLNLNYENNVALSS